MTLRQKAAVIIGTTLVGLLLVLYLTSQGVLLDSFSELETQSTERNVERALNALNDDIASLTRNTRDYASWDDTYQFVQEPDAEYLHENASDEVFANLGNNLAVWVNPAGEVVYAKAFDLQAQQEIPVPPPFDQTLPRDHPLVNHPDIESNINGIYMLADGPMMIASHPILTSNYTGPIGGTLIMGRVLDEAATQRLSESTRQSLRFHRLDDPQLPAELQSIQQSLSPANPLLVRPRNGESIVGYALISDIAQQPALLLEVDLPRTIYQQGRNSIAYFMVLLLISGLIAGMALIWLLERYILAPLTQLSSSVKQVTTSGSGRLPIVGSDELASLAQAINNMLESSESSQKLVRQRRQEAITLLDSIPAYAFFKDASGAYVTANRKFCDAIGCARDEIQGKTDYDFYPRELAEMYRADDSRVMAKGEMVDVGEEEKVEGQNQVTIATRKVPVKDENGQVVGLIGLVFDVTERKRAAEALALARDQALETLRLKSQLLANVSHDLRTPINAILGYSEMLQEEVYGPMAEDQHGVLSRVIVSTKQLASLINNLLDQAQIDAGRLTLNVSPVSPANLIESVVTMVSVMAQSKGIQLNTHVDPTLPPLLSGDPQRLHQIILNLVGNAIKFTDQGSVSIRILRPTSDQWAIEVSDTGAGIPADAQVYIFDAFRQVDGSVTRKHTGVGLGLSIVKQLAVLMGGEVNLVSEVGRGSTFTVTLPLLPVYEVANEPVSV
jgi:PAS domain S-box-containing protein